MGVQSNLSRKTGTHTHTHTVFDGEVTSLAGDSTTGLIPMCCCMFVYLQVCVCACVCVCVCVCVCHPHMMSHLVRSREHSNTPPIYRHCRVSVCCVCVCVSVVDTYTHSQTLCVEVGDQGYFRTVSQVS